MTPLGTTPEALDTVDVHAIFGEPRIVPTIVFRQPVVAAEARLDQAVGAAKAVAGDLFIAANAAFALKEGLWFRLGRLAIFAPSSRRRCRIGSRKYT